MNLAETVGFAYMLQAACAQVCAQLRIPPAGRPSALLASALSEKKKATLRWLSSLNLAETVGFEPTIQV